MQEITSLWTFVRDAGVAGVLLLALVGMVRGWYVPRWIYDQQVTQTKKAEDEVVKWQKLHIERAMPIASTAVDKLAEKL